MDENCFPRSQKLKDSCDMCSAAKTKCNKEKPVCGRCKKLGYPCFYSPARRVGRPHHYRARSYQDTYDEQSVRRRQLVNSPKDNTVQIGPNSFSNEQRDLVHHDNHNRPADNVSGSDDGFNDNQVLGLRKSRTAQNTQTYYPQTEAFVTSEPRLTPQDDALEDVAMFNFNEQIGGAQGFEREESLFQTLSSNDGNVDTDAIFEFCRDAMARNELGNFTQKDSYPGTESPQNQEESSSTFNKDHSMRNADPIDFPEASKEYAAERNDEDTTLPRHMSTRHYRSASTASQLPISLPHVEGFTSHSSECDCATTAMNLLHQLHLTSMKQRTSPTSSDHLDGLLDVVSTAINRVSNIMACPCSQNSDVGLLTAAVCASILDTYRSVLQNSGVSYAATVARPSDDDNEMRGMGGLEEGIYMEAGGVRRLEQETTIRILGELPQIAKLLAQYSKRSTSHEDAEQSGAELLSALVADLKSKLQSTSSEVANWLTQT